MSVSIVVMDGTLGRAAEGMHVTLSREVDREWRWEGGGPVGEGGVLVPVEPVARGRYRLLVDLDRYYPPLGTEPFLSQAEVVFRVFRPGERVRLLVTVTPAALFVTTQIDGLSTVHPKRE
jgi:5-hydroxyisourate hydrolase-like protein (transthyretin family)